jgi:hypothetical protein
VIRRLFDTLPGPAWVRVIQLMILGVIALGLLVFFYEWVGDTFLDSGGTLG